MTPVTETARTRTGGRRARLSRALVLRAALEIADEGGLDALTMQRIGRRLGVEAMSLYRHVRNKEDILDGIVDLVFEEIGLPGDDVDWLDALRMRATSTRDVLARHPWAVGRMESRVQPGPANLHHHDTVLGILFGAGFSSTMATHAYSLLDAYIYGFALQQSNAHLITPDTLSEVTGDVIERMAGDEYPHMQRVGRELMIAGFEFGREFEFGLDLILRAVGQLPRTDERVNARGTTSEGERP
jgi:AcrR family transcriptional regulator